MGAELTQVKDLLPDPLYSKKEREPCFESAMMA